MRVRLLAPKTQAIAAISDGFAPPLLSWIGDKPIPPGYVEISPDPSTRGRLRIANSDLGLPEPEEKPKKASAS